MKGKIKLMKKLFNILLVLLLSMGIFTSNSVKVYAEESGRYDNVDWRITDSGELIIGKEGVTQEFTYRNSRSTSNYPWYSKRDKIKSVRFAGTVKGNGDMSSMFSSLNATSLDLSNFNTSKVTKMHAMFYECKAASLDLSSFDTSNVTRMSYMFYRSQATSITGLNKFNTSNVTEMWGMFYYSQATSLDLSSFDTSKVTDMSLMFCGSQATSLDLSLFDTSKVTDMSRMFSHSQATSITGLNKFNTSKVTNMRGMFYRTKPTSLNLSSFNTSNVTNMESMFGESQATSITGLNKFNTSNVTDMSQMFRDSKATSLDLSSFNTSKVTDMSQMFMDSQATSLDLSSFNTSKVTDMSQMFMDSQATSITGLNKFNTSKVTNMQNMFSSSRATSLDLSSFNTSKVTSMDGMFYSSQATSLDLSSFDTSKVNRMGNMFKDSQATSIIFSDNMLGNNNERFKISKLSGSDWVKVRDKNGNLTNDDTQFSGEQISNLTESTTPKLSGTWVKKSSPEYQAEIDKGQEYISKQGINALNDWVKNGDTWTYTFDVFDDSIPYYIWEDKIPGYTSSVMKPNKDLMNQNGEKYYEIINRSTTLGSLNITKTTNNETEDRFEFTITLDGNGLEGTKVFSNVIFTDGVGKIKLGKNESKLIEGLPAGITYTVEETPYSDYTTTSTGATGTIVQGETQEASFNNVLKHVEDYTIETGFKVKKVIEGNNEIDETFDFIAQINTGEPNKRIILSNGETLTSDASGLIIYEFSLANNEELLFSNLSTGSTYQVTEKAGEYISSYNIIDANDVGSIIQSANENTAQNLALTTAVETLDEDERVEITFTNKIIKKQNLKVAKQVNGNAEDKAKQYEITVELYGLDPMATLDSDAGRFVADEDGYAIKTILLRDGEEFMIPEVPVGTQYVITESPNNTYAAYEIIDANGGNNFVNKIDSNNDINLRLATQMETVNENEEATVKFTNTSQVTLKLEKVVDGNMGNKEDEFEFDVKVWKDAPDIEYINLSNYGGVSQGNGIYRFTLKHGDNIDIVKAFPGYSYEITEVDYSGEGYRTYPNDSMIQGGTISGTLNANTDAKMRNIRGAAVPTEIRFWWWAGIPLVLGPIAWFVFKKRKQHID